MKKHLFKKLFIAFVFLILTIDFFIIDYQDHSFLRMFIPITYMILGAFVGPIGVFALGIISILFLLYGF